MEISLRLAILLVDMFQHFFFFTNHFDLMMVIWWWLVSWLVMILLCAWYVHEMNKLFDHVFFNCVIYDCNGLKCFFFFDLFLIWADYNSNYCSIYLFVCRGHIGSFMPSPGNYMVKFQKFKFLDLHWMIGILCLLCIRFCLFCFVCLRWICFSYCIHRVFSIKRISCEEIVQV